MIPALLAAKPLIKYGVLIGVPIVILIASHTTVYLKGKAATKQEWNASIAEQAAESARQVIKLTDNAQQAVTVQAKEERRVREVIRYIDREVVKYVEQTPAPCVLDARFVRLWDGVGRMLDDQNRVSDPDSGPGASDVRRGGMDDSAVDGVPAR